MKTDINGRSTCPSGCEQYETYWSDIAGRELVAYDYRTVEGELYSTCATTLDEARARRDRWLVHEGREIAEAEAL